MVVNHGTVVRRPDFNYGHTTGSVSHVISEFKSDIALSVLVYILKHLFFILVFRKIDRLIGFFYFPFVKMVQHAVGNSCSLTLDCGVVASRS